MSTSTSTSTSDPGPSTTSEGAGSSGGASSETTGEVAACPDGIELVEIGGTCVSAPLVVDPQPAYDVVGFEGLVVSNDVGVTQYRSVDGALTAVSTVALPSRGQDLVRLQLGYQGETKDDWIEVNRALVTLPGAAALAILTPNDDGLLTSFALLDTGARPMGHDFVPVPTGDGFGYATANADDGTLSLFTHQGDGTLAPAATLTVGGRPRDLASIDEYIGVIDTDASTLTVLTLVEDLEIGQLDTYAVPEGPVSVFRSYISDTGPAGFLVTSGDADRVTLIRADDGSEWSHGDLVGGPSDLVFTGEWFWPDDALGGLGFLGAIAMTDTSRVVLGMHAPSRGGLSLDRILGDFPTADGPVAIELADANGDGRGDFVTASPSSGLAVVFQQ